MTTSVISLPKPFAKATQLNGSRKTIFFVLPMVGRMRPKLKDCLHFLEGEALAVWLELSEAKQKSYKDPKPKIIE